MVAGAWNETPYIDVRVAELRATARELLDQLECSFAEDACDLDGAE